MASMVRMPGLYSPLLRLLRAAICDLVRLYAALDMVGENSLGEGASAIQGRGSQKGKPHEHVGVSLSNTTAGQNDTQLYALLLQPLQHIQGFLDSGSHAATFGAVECLLGLQVA